MYARTTDAVPSGRKVSDVPSTSSNVYICFSTMSDVSPAARANSSVRSTIGMRISEYPYRSKSRRASSSRRFQTSVSPGKMSRNPLTALIFIAALVAY